jgi:flagellar biosynthesis protein FlhA
MMTHITEVVKRHAYELLDRQETQKLVDNLKKKYSAIVEELIPNIMTISNVQKVLQNLLKEQIPVRNLVTILETLADNARTIKDTDVLTEYVRKALSGVISKQYASPDGKIRVITVDPLLEQYISNSIQYSDKGSSLILEPGLIQKILEETASKIETVIQKGYSPIVLCSPLIRFHFKRLTERTLSNLTILAYSEIVATAEVESLGLISVALQAEQKVGV